MKRFTYRIEDQNGMHARPAGMLATQAKRYLSEITVYAGEKKADGKRLLSLMSLGATCGTELIFEINGEDEVLAASELEQFCLTQASSDKMGNDKGNGNDEHEQRK